MNIEGEINIMVYIYTSNIEHLLKKKSKGSTEESIVLLARYESVGTEDRFFSLKFSFVEEPDKKIRCYFDMEEGRNQAFIEIMRKAECYNGEEFEITKLYDYVFEVHMKYDKYLKAYCATNITIRDKDNSRGGTKKC